MVISMLMLLLVINTSVSAQPNLVVKTEAVSIKFLDSLTGTWGEWSSYEELHVVCMYKKELNSYVIYTKQKQTFSILYELEPMTAEDGNFVRGSQCVDDESIECALLFIESPTGEKYIQVSYLNVRITYKLDTSGN